MLKPSGFAVSEVQYNWCYNYNVGDTFAYYSTNEKIYKEGVDGIIYEFDRDPKCIAREIIYHPPIGEGDSHFCYILTKDNKEVLIFNINKIIY